MLFLWPGVHPVDEEGQVKDALRAGVETLFPRVSSKEDGVEEEENPLDSWPLESVKVDFFLLLDFPNHKERNFRWKVPHCWLLSVMMDADE